MTDFLVREEHELAVQILRSSEECRGEFSALKKDGSTFAVEAHGRIIERDGKPVRVTVIRDITIRKQADEALRESQKKYQALIETTGDFVWEMDNRGKYTYYSPQMERLWGLRPEDMIGKTFFDMMPPDDKKSEKEHF